MPRGTRMPDQCVDDLAMLHRRAVLREHVENALGEIATSQKREGQVFRHARVGGGGKHGFEGVAFEKTGERLSGTNRQRSGRRRGSGPFRTAARVAGHTETLRAASRRASSSAPTAGSTSSRSGITSVRRLRRERSKAKRTSS